MKNIFWSALLVIGISFIAVSQTQVVSVKYNGYSIAVPATQEWSGDADLVPVIAGTIDSLSKKASQNRFGIAVGNDLKNLSEVTFLELFDAKTDKVIRKISAAEYFGNENSSWTRVPEESKASASSIVGAFKFTVNGNVLTFIKELALVEDAALPGGKKLQVSFVLSSPAAMKIKVRMSSLVAGNYAKFSNAFSIAYLEPASRVKSSILFYVNTPSAVNIEIAKKDGRQVLTLSGNPVSVTPNQKTKIFSLDVIGSSISFPNYIPKQIENLYHYLSLGTSSPSVAIVPVPDKPKTSPGDTLGYTIYYHNIGTAPASDIKVTGIIPPGTKYLAGSAEGKGTTMSFTRAEAAPPALGEITNIEWMDKTIIKSGEERCVRYKVIVR